MNTSSRGKIVTVKKINWLYYKLLPLLAAGFFGMMIFGLIFDPEYISHPAWILIHVSELFGIAIYAIIIIIIWNFLKKRLSKAKLSKKTEISVVSLTFAILIIIQGAFASQMSAPMPLQCLDLYGVEDAICVWDFNAIASGAAESVGSDLSIGTIDYLHRHQNNIPLFYLLRSVFTIFHNLGITNYQVIGVALNILAINISILLIYLVAKRLWGTKKALFSLFASMFVLPLILMYIPYFYTDTLSLPFPILAVYLYLRMRDSKDFRRSIGWLVGIILTAFIGSMIKFSVSIVLIAIIIDLIIRPLHGKRSIKHILIYLLISVSLFGLMITGYSAFANKFIHSRAIPISITTPWTHYLMMGLNTKTTGGYNMSDDATTSDYTTVSEAMQYNISEIKSRLLEHGIMYPYFLYEKALLTWTDGTYEASFRLANSSFATSEYKPSWLQKQITTYDTYPLTFYNFIQAVQSLILLALMFGAIKLYSGTDHSRNFLLLTISGLALFLLIWEANPRYIVNFLPVILILTTPIWWEYSDKVTSRLIQSYKKARKKVLGY